MVEEKRNVPGREETIEESHNVWDAGELLCGLASYDSLESKPVK